jgi:flagellin-like protein
MKTKAQSQVITTVLLILIVLAAVTIIWTILKPFFNRMDDQSSKCIEVRVEIEKAVSSTDKITVERKSGGAEEDVTGLKLLINDQLAEINSVNGVACTGDACDTSLGRLDKKEFGVTTDFDSGAEIQVAPAVGTQKQLCPVADTYRAS